MGVMVPGFITWRVPLSCFISRLVANTQHQLDESYNLTHTVQAANGLEGDLHEFRLTDRGTAMLTVYDVQEHDLSSVGKGMGLIWDCLVQEINLETRELVFEWRASRHFNIADSFQPIGRTGDPGGVPFDWFHINSIDKDAKGNYLISSRYLHSIAYVAGDTGSVLWVLGGKRNMFKDMSGGRATSFAFQHDARWDKEYSELTLFDNSDDGPPSEKSKPRGLRLRLDQEAMTVELVAEYRNPGPVSSSSQGSMQSLANGNVVVGFGYSGIFTEFSHSGQVLCETHYGPESGFGTGDVQSYRVLKFDWHGRPTTMPSLAVAQDDTGAWRAYVSWNGATEVKEWILQGADDDGGDDEAKGGGTVKWIVIKRQKKDGFETDFALEMKHPKRLRAAGLDSDGTVLGISSVVDARMIWVVSPLTVSPLGWPHDSAKSAPGYWWELGGYRG